MKLTVSNLTKSFQDADRTLTVIESLSYEFPEKGTIAIVGRSGIGKSTLLHILGGLERATSGKILLGNTDISKLTPDELADFRGENVGFVFQFHHLLPEFTALENAAMPLLVRGVADDEAYECASKMLERVGLKDRSSHRPGELSGGEQQRVAIARAIVSRPKLILADEPTGNLDSATAREIQELLLEMNREFQNTLIVVTHSMEMARSLGLSVEMKPGGSLQNV